MKRIYYVLTILLVIMFAGLTGAQQASAMPPPVIPTKAKLIYHIHHKVHRDRVTENWIALTADTWSILKPTQWINVHCYYDTVEIQAVGRTAPHPIGYRAGFTFHWCGAWKGPMGPSLWWSKNWDSAATVTGSITHKTYKMATILGYRYIGLDDTGNSGPSLSHTGNPYGNYSGDSVTVYRRFHWSFCPYHIPLPCSDVYPQIHVRAYPNGSDDLAGSTGIGSVG